jgi:hypothetical protein
MHHILLIFKFKTFFKSLIPNIFNITYFKEFILNNVYISNGLLIDWC